MAGNTFVDLGELLGRGPGASGWDAFGAPVPEEARRDRRENRQPARDAGPGPEARPAAGRPRLLPLAAGGKAQAASQERGEAGRLSPQEALSALPPATVWRAMAFPSLDAEGELRHALAGLGVGEGEQEALVARVSGFGPALRSVFSERALATALVLPGQRVLGVFTSGERRLLDSVPGEDDVKAVLDLLEGVGARGPGARVERFGRGVVVRRFVRPMARAMVGDAASAALERGRHVIVAAPLGVEVGHVLRDVVDAWKAQGPVIVLGEESEGDPAALHLDVPLEQAATLGLPVVVTTPADDSALERLWLQGAPPTAVVTRADRPERALGRAGAAAECVGFVVWVGRDGAAMPFAVDGQGLLPWGGEAGDIAVDEP